MSEISFEMLQRTDELKELIARAIARWSVTGSKEHLDNQEELHWRKYSTEAFGVFLAIVERFPHIITKE